MSNGTASGAFLLKDIYASCAGDCDSSSTVTVDEVILLVNVALGHSTSDACTPGDVNADGEITVDEIVAATNRALDGCD